jgi:uncharacterized protein
MRKILFISIVFLITFLNSAGFDCKKASTPTEQTICSNKSLSLLDDAMRASYDYVINGYKFGYPIYDEAEIETIKKALNKEQREFIKDRETCKNNTSCISDKTEKRIKILNKKSKCNHHVCFNNLAQSNILKEKSDMEYIYRLLYELLKPKERERLQKEQETFEKESRHERSRPGKTILFCRLIDRLLPDHLRLLLCGFHASAGCAAVCPWLRGRHL